MKKFLTVTPQQRPGNLNLTKYDACGNSLLEYEPAHFPVIPLVNGYTEEGDSVQVITLTFDSENCRNNLGILEDDLQALAAKKGISCEVLSVDVPFDNSTERVLDDFLKLIEHVEDHDILHACITFGSKPMTVAMMTALRYAHLVKSNVSIECIVYGEQNYQCDPPAGRIYDLTALIKLDELIGTIADLEVGNPDAIIRQVIEM